MQHPSFTHEQTLPSLKLTKDFLESIEQYLTNRLADTALLSPEEFKAALSIKIEDRLGTETFNSIKLMEASRFADS